MLQFNCAVPICVIIASYIDIQELTAPELCNFLKDNVPSLSQSVIHEINCQRIDGEAPLQITKMSNDKYLREIAPLLGD